MPAEWCSPATRKTMVRVSNQSEPHVCCGHSNVVALMLVAYGNDVEDCCHTDVVVVKGRVGKCVM